MAVGGERFLVFIVSLHVILFFAGTNGMITNEQGENPHLKVINTFEDEDSLSKKGQVSESSGIIEQTFSPVLAVSGLVNSIVGILASPFTSISATPLPPFLKVLFTTVLGLFEIITVYRVGTGRL
jgi:hypothetical protein